MLSQLTAYLSVEFQLLNSLAGAGQTSCLSIYLIMLSKGFFGNCIAISLDTPLLLGTAQTHSSSSQFLVCLLSEKKTGTGLSVLINLINVNLLIQQAPYRHRSMGWGKTNK